MVRKQPGLTIRSYLGRALFLNTMLTLFFCTIGYSWSAITTYREGLHSQIDAIANVLAHSLEASIEFQDERDASKLLTSLRANQNIVGAVVETADAHALATFGEPIGSEITAHIKKDSDGLGQFIGGRFVSMQVIQNDSGAKLGHLFVSARLDSLYEQLWSYLGLVAVLTAAVTALSIISSRWFQARLAQPIIDFVSVVKRSSQDYSLRTATEISNFRVLEIANLSEEFDQMLNQIESRDKSIQAANERLEENVKERTSELVKAQQELIASGRLSALGEMSAGIAHEINNPLAIIAGKCTTINSKIKVRKVPAEAVLEDVSKIEAMVRRISAIIRSLRTFSRDGSQDPFEIVPIKTIVEESFELCGSRFKTHGVDLQVAEIPNLFLECRSTQLGQVFFNLLNNAFDAVNELETKWIRVDFEVISDQRLRWTITDSGSGIPPEIRSRIMEPFFTTKPVGKGTGLGLSIARGIMASHKGSLEIDADCPNTRFVITLPLAPAQAAAA